jgi:hypothetical protein
MNHKNGWGLLPSPDTPADSGRPQMRKQRVCQGFLPLLCVPCVLCGYCGVSNMRYNSKCQSEAPLSSPSPREGRAGRGLGRGASFVAHPTASSVNGSSVSALSRFSAFSYSSQRFSVSVFQRFPCSGLGPSLAPPGLCKPLPLATLGGGHYLVGNGCILGDLKIKHSHGGKVSPIFKSVF